MKIFTFLLIIAAFIQSSFLPINLVLILLICRSLVSYEKENLIMAFGVGILVGILQAQNLGFWPLVFLIVVKLLSLTKKLPFSKNILTTFIVAAIAVVLVNGLESLYFQAAFNLTEVIWEIILCLPAYFLILIWEERFVVKQDSRLKLRN